jgi:hypothetical protein
MQDGKLDPLEIAVFGTYLLAYQIGLPASIVLPILKRDLEQINQIAVEDILPKPSIFLIGSLAVVLPPPKKAKNNNLENQEGTVDDD